MPHFRISISIVLFVLLSLFAMQIRYFVGDFIFLFIDMHGIYTDTQFHRLTSSFLLLLLLLFVKKKFTIAKKLKQNSNKRVYRWRKIERKIKRRTKQIRFGLLCHSRKYSQNMDLFAPKKAKLFSSFSNGFVSAFSYLLCSLFFGAFWERTPYKLRDHICSSVHAPLSVYIQMQI